jgi:tRNA(Ile)-lysidine synthase
MEKVLKFVEKVKKTIKKYRMLESGDRVVVGVSGGPDSMALLYALNRIKKKNNLTLKVAHLNHGFRGKEAQKEAEFVEEMAKKLKLFCEVKTFDVPAYKKKTSLSSQEAARVVRYQFLEEVREQFQASKIALGHNADDQAETLMMWLLRGTGLKGLSGIPPVRENVIVRPLIETTREEIEEYIREKEIPFVIDSSNQKTDYLRNRIRHEIFPLLKEHYNPQLVKGLVQTASIIRQENEYLEGIVKDILKDIIVSKNGESVVIDGKRLLEIPTAIQLRCVRGALEQVKGDLRRISATHLYDIIKIVSNNKPNKVLKLPEGIRVEKSYNHLTVTHHQSTTPPFHYRFTSIPDQINIEEIGKEMRFKTIKGGDQLIKKENPQIAYLDEGKVIMPLTIRNARPGDKFQPLGMKGEKKVKDFFIDEKVPLRERKCVPIFLFDGMLGWVGGMRINHRLRVTRGTRKVLKIEIK